MRWFLIMEQLKNTLDYFTTRFSRLTHHSDSFFFFLQTKSRMRLIVGLRRFSISHRIIFYFIKASSCKSSVDNVTSHTFCEFWIQKVLIKMTNYDDKSREIKKPLPSVQEKADSIKYSGRDTCIARQRDKGPCRGLPRTLSL